MSISFKRVLLLWIPMPLLGIVNGTFRQFVLLKYVSDFHAHQISTFTLIVLIAIYIYFIFNKLELSNYKSAWLIGITWLLLTVIFEFSLGHFVSHLSPDEMLADYNILRGRLWPLVLLSLLFLPVVYYNVFKKSSTSI